MSQAYFSQWQRFPIKTGDWQRGEERIFHQGRVSALQYIVNTSKTVLDVGCGIGLDYQPLSNIAYYGVDVTSRFIRKAKYDNIPCQIASVLDLPFRDCAFETVYCRNLLLHLPPDQIFRALDEMLRVAEKQVVTVEPAWTKTSDFRIRELVDTNPSDVLMFFSNTYSEQKMVEYAEKRRLQTKFWRGFDKARTSFLHKHSEWQVTVYVKK